MFEYLLVLLVGGVPACVAYIVRGRGRFRSIAGTINLALAFLIAAVAAAQLMADPPVRTAMASGFISIVLAVAAVALRLPDPADGDPAPARTPQQQEPQQAPQMMQQPYPAQWAAPQHPGMPGAPHPAPNPAASPGGTPPQQSWGPSGQ